jgi:hypothetical protein
LIAIATEKKIVLAPEVKHATQLGQDWSTSPFVDIITTEDTACPGTHPYEVFYKLS